uniref:TMEM9 domain-containing protein n=1 Tax=Mesocestoides corti TaxID=53468 RepID=A0A5K3EWC2_MESCO
MKMDGWVYSVLLLTLLSAVVNAAYEDARCKCVCVDHSVPKILNESSAEPKRYVFVKSIPSDKCTCPIMLENKSDLCPFCDCKYQIRNTTTIKVVVILIIVIISTLSFYLGFMLLLEPCLASRSRNNLFGMAASASFSPSKTIRTVRSYVLPSQRTSEYNSLADAQGVGVNEPSSSGGGPSAVVNRAREQQSRWKGRIEAQRDRVFNERTILN